MIELTVVDDEEAAARTTAERIASAIAEALVHRGLAHVALAGGQTPARAYELLAELVPDWDGVHLWFGDERCVPLDDPQSNHALVGRTLLAQIPARPGHPPPQVHPVVGVADDPAAAAEAYEHELRTIVNDGDPPRFDLVLLGLGEDGHTASLFAEDPVLDERRRLCLTVRGAKPPFARVTLTLPILRAARRTIVLTAGMGKAWAVGAMLAGPSTRTPASLLADGADVELVVDRAAAPA
jgi:6-phosphogluconolactonase